MAWIKAKARVNGQETEVELDDEQYIPAEQHQVVLNTTIADRLKRHERTLRQQLAGDEEFRAEVFKAAGIDPNKKDSQLSAAEVTRLQAELRKAEVEPLQGRLQEATTKLSTVLERQLVSELTSALIEAGAKKSVARRIAEMEARNFGYDEKTGMHAVKKGEGFAFSSKASEDQPYKGPQEFASEWAANKENADWIEARRQDGPGVGAAPGGPGGNVVTISRADARIASKFKAAEDQAQKLGGTVHIAD